LLRPRSARADGPVSSSTAQVRSRGAKRKGAGSPKIFWKNTGDLQGEMRANYNARPCAIVRKSAGARTGANREKTNAKNNRNSRKSGRAYVRSRRRRTGDGAAHGVAAERIDVFAICG